VPGASLALRSTSFSTISLPAYGSESFPNKVFKNELTESLNLKPGACLMDIQNELYNGVSSGRIIIYPTFEFQESFDILFLSSETFNSLPIYQALELSYSSSGYFLKNIEKLFERFHRKHRSLKSLEWEPLLGVNPDKSVVHVMATYADFPSGIDWEKEFREAGCKNGSDGYQLA